MIKLFLIILVFSLSFAFVYAEDKADMRDMSVACAVINGKLNNGPECVRLQKKLVEDQCKKGDPNSCKALNVAKDGVDKNAIETKADVEKETNTKKTNIKKYKTT
ncbi:MAG: hypothetical protein NTY22_01175 [Proteobacteria bacterium]|nr:hypothetical protein [Pseudomonadota bacterium]